MLKITSLALGLLTVISFMPTPQVMAAPSSDVVIQQPSGELHAERYRHHQRTRYHHQWRRHHYRYRSGRNRAGYVRGGAFLHNPRYGRNHHRRHWQRRS